ncbi:MAG: flagellar hook-basal body complex protein FliE [Hyphomicrobiaceae bacterium]
MIDPVKILSATTEFNASRVDSVATQNVSAQLQGTTSTTANDFGSVLAEVALGVVQDVRAGEQLAISGILGNESTQNVVEAVMTAEQTLQSAIAVRDKVVSAYQEISRMAI